MDNVPVNTNSPTTSRNVDGHHQTPAHRRSKRNGQNFKLVAKIVGLVVALIVLTVGVLFLYRASTVANINNGKYQAVFFTNGQVYFGKLKPLNGSYMKLTDIFYLQAQAKAAETESENPQQTTQDASGVELIKLGSEIHGPEDEMIISKDQVLFFENLKENGTVAESISKYNSQKK